MSIYIETAADLKTYLQDASYYDLLFYQCKQSQTG